MEMNTNGMESLQDACRNGNFQELSSLMINCKEDINLASRTDGGKTLLHLAARAGSLECVAHLVDNNCELDVLDEAGNLPLHYAALSKSHACVKYLIDKGQNLVLENNAKQTSLDLILNNMSGGEELLRQIFDENILLDPEHDDITFYTKVLCPSSEYNKLILAYRLYFRHFQNTSLLLHPLPRSLILLEWNKSRFAVWHRFSFYALYLLALTAFVILPYASDCTRNVLKTLIVILSVHVLFYCIPYFLPGPYSWLRRATVIGLTVLAPLLAILSVAIPYDAEFCGIAFLCSWLTLPSYTNAIGLIGRQAGMFRYITREIFMNSFVLLFVLVGFALSFFILYRDNDNDGFDDFWDSFLYTTLVLLQGSGFKDFQMFDKNYNFNSTEASNESTFNKLIDKFSSMKFASVVTALMFEFVVIIALLNMLIALAVKSGQELQCYGLAYHLRSQVEVLYELNEVKHLWRKVRRRHKEEGLRKVSWKSCDTNKIPVFLKQELHVAARKADQAKEGELTLEAIEKLVQKCVKEGLNERQATD